MTEEPDIEVVLFWSGGSPVPLKFSVDLARTYVAAAREAGGHGVPDVGDLSDPNNVALAFGYALNAVVRAGLPIYAFDETGIWSFQPDSYRGIKIVAPNRKAPSVAMMKRAIGFQRQSAGSDTGRPLASMAESPTRGSAGP